MDRKTYLEYLATCDGQREVYTFDDQSEADEFGNRLRENLCEELDCGLYEIDEFVEVKISRLTVRIKAVVDILQLV